LNEGKTGFVILGCGYGALSYRLLEKGAKVSGNENEDPGNCPYAKKKAVPNKIVQTASRGKTVLFHFPDKTLTWCFIFDVIEHVANPENETLREVWRTLKKGGYLYVEFTPYYSNSRTSLGMTTRNGPSIYCPRKK
jgi:2-polyprenyl-3-methyl-5-hydroxy-6-metoxy-1,4-benzoquinol methylase